MQDVKKAKCPRCKEIWDPPDVYHPIADVKDGYLVVFCPTCSLENFNKACAEEEKEIDPLAEERVALEEYYQGRATASAKRKASKDLKSNHSEEYSDLVLKHRQS